MKLLILFLLLSLASGSDISLSVSGHITGNGTNETIIEIGDGNWSGNGTAWMITWEDNLWERK